MGSWWAGVSGRLSTLLLFRGPIREKFSVFCGCASVGVCALGIAAAATTASAGARGVFLAATALFLVPLVGFGVLLSRAIERPIEAMRLQIAALAAGSLEAVHLEVHTQDELRDLARDLENLLTSTTELAAFKHVIEGDETVEDVYARLGVALKGLGVGAFQVMEVSNSRNRLRPVLREGGPEGDWCSKETMIDCNRCRARRSGEVVSSSAFPGVCKHFQLPGVEHLCVPMSMGGTTGGVAQFIFEAPPERDLVLKDRLVKARRFVDAALPVIEARRLMSALKESSVRDAMTGLYNRRFVEECADSLVAQAARRGTGIGLIMCDVDHFKRVNDEHGHDAGDAVLRAIAGVLSRTLRASDIAVRYGGEEFLLVLTDCRPEMLLDVAERLRAAVEETRINVGGGLVLQKTLSLGVAEFPKDSSDLWTAVKYADVALYRAKEHGRNRVVQFTPELWPAANDDARILRKVA